MTETLGICQHRYVVCDCLYPTAVFVILYVELGEETGGTNGDERRPIGICPEEIGKLLKSVFVEVVGDDEGEVADPVPTLICTEELVDVFDDGLSLDGIVEFAEEGDGFLSTRLADAFPGIEEEVVACICGGCGCSV